MTRYIPTAVKSNIDGVETLIEKDRGPAPARSGHRDRIGVGTAGLALAAALALAACNASNDKAAISSAESALTVGGHAVLAYDALPACPLNTPLCHTDAVKARAAAAFDAAYLTVTQAQATADAGGKPDVVAVQAAITALQSVVSMFPKAQ